MNLALTSHKFIMVLAITGGIISPLESQAATIDFQADLTNGTCTLNLDKSTLELGTIVRSQLTRGRLIAPKPFVLSVRNCIGQPGGSLIPAVSITGVGFMRDGRWSFRNPGSVPGVGFMVFQGNSVPEYSSAEIQSDIELPLAAAGQIPADQALNFYAAASCGTGIACDASATGNVTANLLFSFVYK